MHLTSLAEANQQQFDIGVLLLARGLLTDVTLERARRLESESGERIDRIAAKLGLVTERDLAETYAALLDSELLTAADFPAEPVAADRLQAAFLHHARAIPLAEDSETLTLAMADPLDDDSARAVSFACDKRIQLRVATAADIEAAYERLYGTKRSQIARMSEDEDRASVVI